MRKGEMITGVVLLALAGAVIADSSKMPSAASFGPGPGFLPFWLGVILAILAAILLVKAWRRAPEEKDKKPLFPGKEAMLAIGLILVAVVAYILLIEVLGYVIDTFLLVLFLMKVVQRQKWTLSFATSVGSSAGLFFLFHTLLRITLPTNALGF